MCHLLSHARMLKAFIIQFFPRLCITLDFWRSGGQQSSSHLLNSYLVNLVWPTATLSCVIFQKFSWVNKHYFRLVHPSLQERPKLFIQALESFLLFHRWWCKQGRLGYIRPCAPPPHPRAPLLHSPPQRNDRSARICWCTQEREQQRVNREGETEQGKGKEKILENEVRKIATAKKNARVSVSSACLFCFRYGAGNKSAVDQLGLQI